MRYAFVAAAAAGILAACGPAAQSPMPGPRSAEAATGAFPDVFQAAYRAEAAMTGSAGEIIPVVVVQDRAKTRVEIPTAEGPVFRAVDSASGEIALWRHVRGRPVLLASPIASDTPVPVGAPPPPAYVFPDLWWQGDVAASMAPVGSCSHLGQSGGEWERDQEQGPQHVCITADGIVLWATDNGRTVWQLTSLQRGAQEPSQFSAPSRARLTAPEAAQATDDTAAYVPPPQFSPDMNPPAPKKQ